MTKNHLINIISRQERCKVKKKLYFNTQLLTGHIRVNRNPKHKATTFFFFAFWFCFSARCTTMRVLGKLLEWFLVGQHASWSWIWWDFVIFCTHNPFRSLFCTRKRMSTFLFFWFCTWSVQASANVDCRENLLINNVNENI